MDNEKGRKLCQGSVILTPRQVSAYSFDIMNQSMPMNTFLSDSQPIKTIINLNRLNHLKMDKRLRRHWRLYILLHATEILFLKRKVRCVLYYSR